MNNITKRISALLLSLLLGVALLPTTALAAGRIFPAQDASLTISYKDGTKAISEAQFDIYRVADVDEYAHMTLTDTFVPYKDSVSGLSSLENMDNDSWLELASTLKVYVQRDSIAPDASGKTGSDGRLMFSRLKPGLYLVLGYQTTTKDYYTYSAVPSMVFLPGEDTVNNDWDYDVMVEPKFSKDYNPPGEKVITRKVLKVWDDEGYETIRPTEVIVKLLCDGKVYNTQTLNKDNNWRYTWDNLDPHHDWQVIEKEMSHYSATVTQTGITFTVTNKYVAPTTTGNLDVQKRITGNKPSTDSVFTFVMTAKDVSCPMPKGSKGTVKEISITGAGSKKFGEITFTSPGTYVYTISEKNTSEDGYNYDTTVYTVTYEVVHKDGELTVTRTIKDNKGNNVSALEFTNNYKTPGNKLPQTGILWWPVPILLCVGIVFLTVGIIRRRRSE